MCGVHRQSPTGSTKETSPPRLRLPATTCSTKTCCCLLCFALEQQRRRQHSWVAVSCESARSSFWWKTTTTTTPTTPTSARDLLRSCPVKYFRLRPLQRRAPRRSWRCGATRNSRTCRRRRRCRRGRRCRCCRCRHSSHSASAFCRLRLGPSAQSKDPSSSFFFFCAFWSLGGCCRNNCGRPTCSWRQCLLHQHQHHLRWHRRATPSPDLFQRHAFERRRAAVELCQTTGTGPRP